MSYCRTVKPRTTQQKPRPQHNSRQTEMEPSDSYSYDRQHQSSNIHGFSSTQHYGSRPRRGRGHPYGDQPYGRIGGTRYPGYNESGRERGTHGDPVGGGASYHPSQHINNDGESDPHDQLHHQSDPSPSSLYQVSHNPVKHAKMIEMARTEEMLYEEHKQEKRERAACHLRTQEPQRLGGQSLSRDQLDATRKQQQLDQQRAKIRKKIEREERDALRKKQEQEKIDQYKLEQRKKAEKLELKKREEDRKTQVDLEELRRKRQERFS